MNIIFMNYKKRRIPRKLKKKYLKMGIIIIKTPDQEWVDRWIELSKQKQPLILINEK